jgi:hypothetical protein
MFRVNAGASQKEQTPDACTESLVNHIAFDHQVLKDEIRPIGIVGKYSADFCSRKNDIINGFGAKKMAHGLLIRQVQFPVSPGNQVLMPAGLQKSHNRRPHHAAMARNKNS